MIHADKDGLEPLGAARRGGAGRDNMTLAQRPGSAPAREETTGGVGTTRGGAGASPQRLPSACARVSRPKTMGKLVALTLLGAGLALIGERLMTLR